MKKKGIPHLLYLMLSALIICCSCSVQADPNDDANGDLNDPPSSPLINGPVRGLVGEEYTYSFYATDPNGDDIFFIIDWGDGGETSIGPVPSGSVAYTNHTFYIMGTFTIRAKTVDMHDAMSNWATLVVSMPKGYSEYACEEYMCEYAE